MSKSLRSLTIIPDGLYVEREADRQLSGIVANMGRPGYVLVARQMGKTNLLLHARRRASESGVFVYLDLSNTFPDIRSFFRNIVDVAAEGSAALSEVMHQIRLARSNLDRLPHKEHEWELRTLLGELQGKLVICLDEIDSLTKSEYSDQVFSFIRSVYFSGRANFRELERLTYLLSGVAEPADIIKNRDISPFNIGEKILLQDFSFEELQELVARAALSLPDATMASIYQWTNGHPRMSWDICSRLEDIALNGMNLEPNDVDHVVKGLYFTEVNMPPVDQVKRLAEDSSEIRDALISVHYGRGGTVPDSTRTKLYLAGICQASQSKVVIFKNKILEEALSEKFLLSIESDGEDESSIAAGEQDFHAGQFVKAIGRFNASLQAATDSDDAQLQGRAHYWLARTRFALGELESASVDFQAASHLLDGEDGIINSFYFGHLLSARAQYKEARAEYEQVRQKATSKTLALEATVDLASAFVAIDPSDRGGIAEKLCLEIGSSKGEILNSAGYERMGGDTVAMAHYVLASIYLKRGKRSDALREIDLGLETASVNINIRLMLLQADVVLGARDFFLTKAKALVISDSNMCDGAAAKSISYETYRDLILRLDRVERTSDALELVEHMLSAATSEDGFANIFERITFDTLHVAATRLAGRIFEQVLIKHGHRFTAGDTRRYITTVCTLSPERAFIFSDQFLNLVESQGGELNASELMFLNNIVFYSITSRSIELLRRALTFIQAEPSDLGAFNPAQLIAWKLFKEYLESYSALALSPDVHSFERARRLFWALQDVRSFELGNIKSDFIRSMRDSLEKELRQHSESFGEVRRIRKIGRNEIIKVSYNGKIKTGKFKHLQFDLNVGNCMLVDL